MARSARRVASALGSPRRRALRLARPCTGALALVLGVACGDGVDSTFVTGVAFIEPSFPSAGDTPSSPSPTAPSAEGGTASGGMASGGKGSSDGAASGGGPSGAVASDDAASGDDGSDGEASVDPLYLVHSAVQGDDGRRINYFTPVASLTEARTLDYSTSLELPGRARLYAAAATDTLIIGDGESLTLQRYTLSASGELRPEGPRLSLQSQGVTSLGAQAMAFVSPTKAYYKDSAQAQVLVIDPSAMTVERVLPLPAELIREGYVMNLSDWAVREGEAYFAVGWTTDVYDRALEGSVLVRLDTESDALTTSADARCRELSTAANLDGTLYFFSGVINAFGHAVYPDDAGQQDCILRVLPGERTFDPSVVGTLSAALPEQSGAMAVTLTDDGVVWANVADLMLANTAPGTTYNEWYETGWSWWSMKLDVASLGTEGPATRVDQAPGAFSSSALSFGSAFIISQAADDYSLTTLVDLSRGTPAPGLAYPGFTLDIVRVR